MTHRLILFDIDGTLIETGGAGKRALEQAFGDIFRVEDYPDRTAVVEYSGRTDPHIMRQIARALDIEPHRFQERREELLGRYFGNLQQLMQEDHPHKRTLPGVTALLESVDRDPGVTLGLLTGNLERSARIKLDAFDLNRFFADGGFSSDHEDRREIARIAREKMERCSGISYQAEAVIVVGDTPHDVDCARANGFRSVAVSSGFATAESLRAAEPDVLLEDFSDVSAGLEALS